MKNLTQEQKNKLYEKRVISQEKYELLKDFMMQIYHRYHNDENIDIEAWAKKLDQADIEWSIQNLASYCMKDYNSKHFYCSTLLADKNIYVEGVTIFYTIRQSKIVEIQRSELKSWETLFNTKKEALIYLDKSRLNVNCLS